jgi:hypothetical protein
MKFMPARAWSGLVVGVLFSLMLTPAHAERIIEGRVTVVRDPPCQ